MLFIDVLAKHIRDDVSFTGVPVRAFSDDSDQDEQILITTHQGYPSAGDAPVFSSQYSVYARALTHSRALSMCTRAYESLINFVPREGTDYAHAKPILLLAPGYISDDGVGRPTYGFTLIYAATPQHLA